MVALVVHEHRHDFVVANLHGRSLPFPSGMFNPRSFPSIPYRSIAGQAHAAPGVLFGYLAYLVRANLGLYRSLLTLWGDWGAWEFPTVTKEPHYSPLRTVTALGGLTSLVSPNSAPWKTTRRQIMRICYTLSI